MSRSNFKTIDGYIGFFPNHVQTILKQVRATIRKTAPKATETISYQIPTFKLDGKYLVYFAAFKNHVSLYPVTDDTAKAIKKLAPYRSGRGTVRFTLDQPVPVDLVAKIVRYRLKQLAGK